MNTDDKSKDTKVDNLTDTAKHAAARVMETTRKAGESLKAMGNKAMHAVDDLADKVATKLKMKGNSEHKPGA